jgi:rSAM/selenodomain-associated transferase 1
MRRLALFARWPAAGAVKTRLSPALPPALACDLYRAMLEDAVALVAGADAGERFLYWAGAPAARAGFATPPGFHVRDQQDGDLGARLERAFEELLRAPEDRAVIVGADCPALEPSTLRAAFEALESREAVLGPARDGGYYLLGLGRLAPALFRGIEWSSAQVLDQTLARATEAGLTITLLPVLEDLDTPEDLLRWLACRMSGSGPAAPLALDVALRAIGLLPPG